MLCKEKNTMKCKKLSAIYFVTAVGKGFMFFRGIVHFAFALNARVNCSNHRMTGALGAIISNTNGVKKSFYI